MNSRQFTRSHKCVAEIERSKPKNPTKQSKKSLVNQYCKNPQCNKSVAGFSKLKTHITGRRNKMNCIRYYGEKNLLDNLFSNAKNEKKFHQKTKTPVNFKRHLLTAKRDFTKKVNEVFKINVNQVKVLFFQKQVFNKLRELISKSGQIPA